MKTKLPHETKKHVLAILSNNGIIAMDRLIFYSLSNKTRGRANKLAELNARVRELDTAARVIKSL